MFSGELAYTVISEVSFSLPGMNTGIADVLNLLVFSL
jgi:hypothetical protein